MLDVALTNCLINIHQIYLINKHLFWQTLPTLTALTKGRLAIMLIFGS